MVVVLKQLMRSNRNRNRLGWCAVGLTLALAGCGGGGGSGSVNAVATGETHAQAANSFTISSDDYGVQNATYLAATTSPGGMVLRAAIASSMTDPSFRTTVRVDIDTPSLITAPGVYSLGGATGGVPLFPGRLYFFDGHPSTLLETVGGTITFRSFGTRPGDPIAGSFTATVRDGNDSAGSTYTVSADFSFTEGSYGPVTPAATPIPATAAAVYQGACAGCHTLGSFDSTFGGACDLALKGGKLRELMVPDTASHQGIRLSASDISSLKILLNAN